MKIESCLTTIALLRRTIAPCYECKCVFRTEQWLTLFVLERGPFLINADASTPVSLSSALASLHQTILAQITVATFQTRPASHNINQILIFLIKMSSRSAIHQLRRPRMASREGSSSQAHNLLYGWNPETEREPDPFKGPPLSDSKRGLPKRNRAPSGRRPSAPKPPASKGTESRQRRPSLVEMLRAATSRRPSDVTSSKANAKLSRKRGPSMEAAARRRRLSNASFTAAEIKPSRKRGPSLVEKAKELLLVNQSRTNTNAEPSFGCLPDHLSSLDRSASENEKTRLDIESKTRSFDLVMRWMDPTDWLKPSNFWKRTHPCMNFRLWRIIQRNAHNDVELKASADRNVAAAKLLYEQKGGDSAEWWDDDLEWEALISWSLAYGGQDPPRRDWKLP